MKVLLLDHNIRQGGSHQVLVNVAESFLTLLNAEVHIVCAKKIVELSINKKIQIHFNTLPTNYVHKKLKFICDFDMKHKVTYLEKKYGPFNIILSNFLHRNLLFSKSIREKTYYWAHMDPTVQLEHRKQHLPKVYRREIKKLHKYYNNKKVIAVSNGTQQGLLQKAKIMPHSIHTIYNSFDFSKIKNLSNQPNQQIPKEKYILHASRFDLPQKRTDILFSAFAKLKSNCKMVLLIDPCEQAYQLLQKHQIQDKVIMVGFKQNPFNWFKHAQLTVISSDFEAFGNVIVESLICGTPVISTDCISGPSEILTGNMANWLVPPGDPDALAQKIDQLLNNPEPINFDSLEKFSAKNILTQLIELPLQKSSNKLTTNIEQNI